MRSFFLSVFLTLCACAAYAQLPVIAKDYKQCTVGLQDAKGNWLTPPVYTDIHPFQNKQAIAIRDGLYGVLDASGKERIPAIYTHVELLQGRSDRYGFVFYNLYNCRSENATTIIDTTGKIVLHVAMKLTTFYNDRTAIGADSTGKWFLVWLSGKVVPLPSTVHSIPTRLTSGLFAFETNTQLKYTGVIDTNARIILPPVYSKITAYTDRFTVMRADVRDSAFYFTPGGKLIVGLGRRQFDFAQNPFSYSGLLVAKNEKSFGVVSWQGDTLLPFIYESAPMVLTTHNFIVRIDGKYAAVTDSTCNRPAVLYDQLLPAYYHNPARIPGNHFYAKNESGWNLLDAQGQPYFVEAQDTFLLTGNEVLFVKDKDITAVRFDWFACTVGLTEAMYKAWEPLIKQRRPVYTEEDYPVYADTLLEENYQWYDAYDLALEADSIEPYRIDRKKKPVNPYPYVVQFKGEQFMTQCLLDTIDCGVPGFTVYLSPKREYYESYAHTQIAGVTETDSSGKFHFYTPLISIGNRIVMWSPGRTLVLTASGKLLIKPGTYSSFGTTQDSSGTIIAFDGKQNVLLDSNGAVIYETHSRYIQALEPGLIWIGDSVPVSKYSRCFTTVWKLYDYGARRLILDSSLRITVAFRLDSEVKTLSTQRGSGLISAGNQRIIAQPVYGEIIDIDEADRFHVVRTCRGALGLIDSTGAFLLDTIYEGFSRLRGNTMLTKPASASLQPSDVFLFFNHRDSLALFYGNGTINRIDTSEHDFLLKLINAEFLTQNNGGSYCKDCHTTLEYRTGTSMRAWQRTLMYHHIFDSCGRRTPEIYNYFSESDQCACGYRYNTLPSYALNPNGLQAVTVHHTTDSLLVFDNHYVPGSTYFVCHNMMLTARGPVRLTLDSLFTGSAWRQIITDSVLAYLDAHPGINANCSQPGRYPDILKNRFLMNPEGLCLYPEWYGKTDGSRLEYLPCVVIPWSALQPYLHADIKRKLGMS